MEIAPHLRRLGSSSLVNSYLVEEGGSITVIDAGIPGLWDDLLGEIAGIGRTLDDVKAVLLTHGDVDHVGFALDLKILLLTIWRVLRREATSAPGHATMPDFLGRRDD